MRSVPVLVLAVLLALGTVEARTILQGRRRQTPDSAKALGQQKQGQRFIPGSYIVSLKDDCQPGAKGAAKGLADKTKSNHKVDIDHVYEHVMRGFAFKTNPNSQNEKNAIAALKADPCVRNVEQNRVVRANQAQTVPTGVRRLGVTNPRASSVAVAIIDTGILSTHPDLAGLVKGGINCVSGTGSTTASYEDDHGHGTHVAGTVAALNNGIGVVGVAAGTDLYAVKVLDASGSGSDASVICGLNWVAQQNAGLTKKIRVVNLSLGGGAESDARVPLNEKCKSRITYSAQHEAVCKLARNINDNGAVVVVAAGNEGSDLDTSTPAAYPEALTVTAVSDYDGTSAGGDSFASFSNYVSPYKKDAVLHTVAAPGVSIQSTTKDGAYGSMSGTSMASPHVAGVVALCFGTTAPGPCSTAWSKDSYNYGLNVIKLFVRGDTVYKQTGTSGFSGDRDRCNSNGCSRHYGYLVNAASF